MPVDDLCVSRVPIFQGLTREEQLRVAEFVRPVHVAKGETVYSPGQSVSRLLVMHSGQLKVSHAAANGQEQILRTVTDGDVVGERAFLTGHLPNDLVVALEDSRMCVFDHTDLSALLRDYPDVGLRMLRTLSDRLASVERLLAAITSSDVSARIAAYLLDLPGSIRDGVPTVWLPLAKYEIASYLGTTPETLSRRLAALSASGVIELHGRRDVTILDIDGLERVATPR
ncbi:MULTISPECIES: Crp/Fnr family transcriptional regulator [Micrococcales]|jgi:CRP/FNR family transcriptional regulator|uniref:Crp/Fnr family transcriptional regulator n=1 Tax=Sediminivirga luteola TaxID=1774748 RepID=A0A8J2U0Z4_9MICO|nr:MULTISPECIES: Crp/Fnr family transcriptional regulator [Micrococcales]ALJ20597.1 Crp/Fnr family transcriptional regulator [Microbacterium sp. No. 7]ALJ22419.1 Crp/Fnr family transcriptional regulator [Microbacterium sp. No. 7]MCI2264866.1 Crp/Fnr family transcriptional regulator [Sediminivirga luteola]MTE24065.1 helix-turn-helix domain-containing protein [Microbacterium sp. ZXX196]RGE18926.1 Crp/Fnr family transcriptional regulator [Leucobacter sp. wl10]